MTSSDSYLLNPVISPDPSKNDQKEKVERSLRHLKSTFWLGGANPGLAGNMMTTPEDYDAILRQVLRFFPFVFGCSRASIKANYGLSGS